MRLPRLRLRTLLIAVAIVAIALGGGVWVYRLGRWSAYYAFVAGAYEVEAKNHGSFIASQVANVSMARGLRQPLA